MMDRSPLPWLELEVLREVRVAAPCDQDWESMVGDDKVRFCRACRLNVYNLSAMDVEEAAERISQEGDLCIRFHRRADGTLLTRDCPVGVRRLKVRRQGVVRNTVAAFFVASFGAAMLWPMGAYPREAARRVTLLSCARAGQTEGLEQLLTRISPNAQTKSGVTPLMLAAQGGHLPVIRLLLRHGADPDLKDQQGRTARDYALRSGQRNAARLLGNVSSVPGSAK